jgi:two-component system, sensor histidine kinase
VHTGKLRILVVDDHALSRQVAAVLLRHLDHEYLLAEDGQQALAVLASEPVDLVLLDVAMPVLDGPGVLQQLRSRADLAHQVPVLMLTADVQPADLQRYRALGANGCIGKPISTDRLREALLRLLPGSSARVPPAHT